MFLRCYFTWYCDFKKTLLTIAMVYPERRRVLFTLDLVTSLYSSPYEKTFTFCTGAGVSELHKIPLN